MISRALFLCIAVPCFGQVTIQAVTDSAAFGPRVAPGSIATIFGTNLASSTVQAQSYPLPDSLGGTSVMVGTTAAPLFYVSSGVINFQVPSATAAGTATVTVTSPSGTSSAFDFTVVAEAPAIYQNGVNHAAAINSNGSINSDSNRAAAGSVLSVYLTGQGPVTNPVADGAAAPTSPLSNATATVSVTVGASSATVQFLGLAPTFAGVGQANIVVPSLPTGDYPLVFLIGGYQSTSAVVSVSGSGTYTSPLALVGVASFSNPGTQSTTLLNNTVYVCGSDQITMVDVTTATSPAVVGSFGSAELDGYGTICAVNANTSPPILVDVVGELSLNNTMDFAVYSLANNQSPTLLAFASTPYSYIVSLSFAGNVGFVTTSYFTYSNPSLSIIGQTGTFLAFSFATPSQPQFIAELSDLSDENLMPYSAVIGSTGFAYIASGTGTGSTTTGTGLLDVVSMSTPTEMYLVEQVPASPAAILMSFDVSGSTLLACGNTEGNRNPGNPNFGFTGDLTVTTMDVASVTSPAVITSVQTNLQVNGTFYTAAFDNGYFAIVNNAPVSDFLGPQSLMLIDATTPSNPVLYPVQTQFGFGSPVPTSNGYLLAGNDLGLYVYKLQI